MCPGMGQLRLLSPPGVGRGVEAEASAGRGGTGLENGPGEVSGVLPLTLGTE